ncbi:MAG: UbiA family prenyltransferase [Sulfitobacter sp.]
MTDDSVLIVDLDGTLIRSDMLFETFWSAFSRDWMTPVVAATSLIGGRTALKRRLAERGAVDVALLPYNEDVLERVRDWRAQGGRAALVSASDETVVRQIAAHLGIFDEVHGSSGDINLKGRHKAAFLTDRFSDGFAYIGDTDADLPVWKAATKAITVTPSQALRGKVDAMGGEVEHFAAAKTPLATYIKALRPHQWLKNILVFLPMFTAHQLNLVTVWQSVLAFIAFCLVASSVYVLNDLLDLDSDRSHPRKRNRPFASGKLPLIHGTWMVPLLLLASVIAMLPLGIGFMGVMLGYYAATTAYSLFLKRRLIIDICMLAGLYTMRILAGGVATGLTLSVWLLAFSIFLFFSLASVKRQAELVDSIAAGKMTAHGRGYRADDLPVVTSMAIAAGYVSVLVMALYVNSPVVLQLYTYPYALWGICLVLLYWVSRMVMVTHRGRMNDDPVVYAAKDKVSLFCFVLIAGFAAGGAVL